MTDETHLILTKKDNVTIVGFRDPTILDAYHINEVSKQLYELIAKGDYRLLVLAPSTIQEAVDLMMLAFHLADKYRNPVMMIGDGMIGQMMEPVEFPDDYKEPPLPPKDWAATGAKGREPVIIRSLFLDPLLLEKNALVMQEKYEQMKREEVRFELYNVGPKNKILIASYGTMARICETAIDELESEGVSVGLFRPITLLPFPTRRLCY